ncbi:hypothetical protein JS958_001339 [Salmonella enterica subsp. enterica serovar Infantis]|nr:hypothetical protein [Salmonella enterica subsp. enterica serovar Javiana]EHC4523578.1 hypothetical protein [Salmonella enterica subsp. enterica serovar Infantis]EHC5870329.1 hypothetical protein [Salmonella enterica subsp. enterica serovar Eastbourne]EMB5319112.1 hypothetical protein [Salmonella enterica]EHC5910370.1 hypothetical protein [Salmonella enterica subsp. enterica serovar Eastbourne]
MLTVTSAQYPRPGERHVYIMNNGFVMYEMPHLPLRSGVRCYDAAGHRIYKIAVINEMKAAVKRHKEKWRLAK